MGLFGLRRVAPKAIVSAQQEEASKGVTTVVAALEKKAEVTSATVPVKANSALDEDIRQAIVQARSSMDLLKAKQKTEGELRQKEWEAKRAAEQVQAESDLISALEAGRVGLPEKIRQAGLTGKTYVDIAIIPETFIHHFGSVKRTHCVSRFPEESDNYYVSRFPDLKDSMSKIIEQYCKDLEIEGLIVTVSPVQTTNNHYPKSAVIRGHINKTEVVPEQTISWHLDRGIWMKKNKDKKEISSS